MSKPGADPSSGISSGDAWDGPSGIRRAGGAKLDQALVRNVRTYTAMPREKAQAALTARPKVPMRRLGADCSVVVVKRGNARGAKGAGHRHWPRVNRQREEPDLNGRRQPACDGTSRMTRECQVRICERLGVKFPGPTRQKSPCRDARSTANWRHQATSGF